MRPSRLALFTALGLGCSAEETGVTDCSGANCMTPGRDAGQRADARPGDVGGDARTDRGGMDAPTAADVVDGRQVRSVTIEPPTAALRVSGSTVPEQRFRVMVEHVDGSRAEAAVRTWILPANAIATVTDEGLLRPTGRVGGRLTLAVEVPGQSGTTLRAMATVDVQVERRVFASRVLPDVADRFNPSAMDDPARAVTLRYPLDGAVIPSNVAAPDVQWEGGAAGDIYRVRIRKPHFEVSGYVLHSGADFRYDWVVDAEAWRSLLESDPGERMTLAVERWDSAMMQRVAGAPITLEVARAALSGNIYYWDLSAGQILRIDAISAERTIAVPSPPPKPDAPDQGTRCIACHALSRDGRYMAVEMWGGDRPGAVFDLTATDLRSDPAPTVAGPRNDLVWLFSTFSPDSELLITNRGNAFALLRRSTGQVVAAPTLPSTGAAHPEWSPDGMNVAYVSNTDGNWAVDFTRGDLTLLPRTGETTFGTPRVLHVGASSPGGTVDAHPSWSPDSRWVAFQHGTHSRSGGGMGERYPGRVEMLPANAAMGETPRVLDRAVGGTDAYWPNFSPFVSGGYYWLAFYSRRDYGNAQAGTRNSRRRQVWVTAVSTTPEPGRDPSSVPYWLPGQNPAVENISAFWAPIACRATGTRCAGSTECCTGSCERQGDGTYACAAPPAGMCRRVNNTCSMDSDCCEGLRCIGNVCANPPG